jgi:hypothetical protein
MMICRTLRAAFIGLWLSGCSVVVFEDGPACPADRACPVAVTPLLHQLMRHLLKLRTRLQPKHQTKPQIK